MSVASRPVSTGKTRTCPHCKATILESLSICPGCLHHLRFDSEAARRQVAAAPALRVEGIIRHPPLDPPLEYFVVIGVRNDRGEEVTRQVVNVGALQSGEKRTFSLSVEVLPVQAPAVVKPPAATTQTSTTLKTPAMANPSPAPTTTVASSPRLTPTSGLQPPAPTRPAGNPGPAPKTANPLNPANPATSANPANPAHPGPAGSGSPAAGAGLKPPVPGGPKPPMPGGPKRH